MFSSSPIIAIAAAGVDADAVRHPGDRHCRCDCRCRRAAAPDRRTVAVAGRHAVAGHKASRGGDPDRLLRDAVAAAGSHSPLNCRNRPAASERRAGAGDFPGRDSDSARGLLDAAVACRAAAACQRRRPPHCRTMDAAVDKCRFAAGRRCAPSHAAAAVARSGVRHSHRHPAVLSCRASCCAWRRAG